MIAHPETKILPSKEAIIHFANHLIRCPGVGERCASNELKLESAPLPDFPFFNIFTISRCARLATYQSCALFSLSHAERFTWRTCVLRFHIEIDVFCVKMNCCIFVVVVFEFLTPLRTYLFSTFLPFSSIS